MDAVAPNKTIYDVSAGTVFWKNFLAGFGRALGGMVIYLVFLIISTIIFIHFVGPMLTPIFDLYSKSMGTLQQINNLTGGNRSPKPSEQPAPEITLPNIFGRTQ